MFCLSQNKSNQQLINQADSLFEQEKYVDALFLYDTLFSIKKVYSQQMLLKLSFIEEGLNEYENALFYLSYLYKKHPNQLIAEKIITLSDKHELSGYQFNDLSLLFKLYTNYFVYIISSFVLVLVFLVSILVFQKINKNRIDYALIFVISLISFGTFYIANYNPFPVEAIINQPNTLLMTAPSSASDLINKLDQGHKTIIIDEVDNWYQIELDDTTAFVKKNQLHPLKD